MVDLGRSWKCRNHARKRFKKKTSGIKWGRLLKHQALRKMSTTLFVIIKAAMVSCSCVIKHPRAFEGCKAKDANALASTTSHSTRSSDFAMKRHCHNIQDTLSDLNSAPRPLRTLSAGDPNPQRIPGRSFLCQRSRTDLCNVC